MILTIIMSMLFMLHPPQPCKTEYKTRKATVQEMKNFAVATADYHKVDKHLVLAVINTESRWKHNAMGDNNRSYGLFQIMCPTAREVGFKGECKELLEYRTNIIYGVKYLSLKIDKHGFKRGISAYNAGRPIYAVCGKSFINQKYVNTVLRYYKSYKSNKS